MPLSKSAKKKLRQDQKRQVLNLSFKRKYKKALKEVLKSPTKENIAKAYSAIDRAAKRKIIHQNKAARLKARIAHEA